MHSWWSSAWAEDIEFPANSGVVNVVLRYGAKGDGQTDNSAAIQKAIDENRRQFRMLYFPNGTYVVSRTLSYGADLELAKHITMQGQSEKGVIIQLKDRCPGFTDSAKPAPLLTMFAGDHTGMAFQNSLYNMTFDVGRGNPGAIGVQWMNNNQGAMRNVTIRSSDPDHAGHIGLDLTRTEPGPALMSYVTVDGFDHGIEAVPGPFSTTYEHCTLMHQRKYGVYDHWHTMVFRDLKSFNSVPAFKSTTGAYFLVIDSMLAGGSADNPAIDNRDGALFVLRNVKQQGYKELMLGPSDAVQVAGNQVAEFVSGASKASSAFGDSPRHTLRLPVEETPQIPWDPLSKWQVIDPAALADETYDSEIIQKAFDDAAKSGKTTVCFPRLANGEINFDETIHIPPQIHRVIGLDGALNMTPDLQKSTKPVFVVEGDTHEPLVIERFFFIDWKPNKNYTFIQHESSRPLVLRNFIAPGHAYVAGPHAGPLYVEDICACEMTLRKGQKAWMRQWNPETNNIAMTNNGADLWILGLKAETGGATLIKTVEGGRTELLGGQNYSSWGPLADKQPMFIVENAVASFSIFQLSFDPSHGYNVAIRETRGGTTKELSNGDAGCEPNNSYPLINAGK